MRRIAMTVLLGLALGAVPASAAQPKMWSHGADPAPKRVAKGQAKAAANFPQTPSETLPQRWCGGETHVDDPTHKVGTGAFDFHAVYVVAADAPTQLDTIADSIQSDALEASALLERLYSRAIRFDMGTRCGPRYLDITTVRTAQTSAQLNALPGDALFGAVRRAIARAGFLLDDGGDTGMSTNFIAWLDGPAPAGICG
jgi:hypothetical protein